MDEPRTPTIPPGSYVNFLRVAHAPSEFYLAFGQLAPGRFRLGVGLGDEGLLAYGRASRAMGFEGMGCIHPRQVPVIHESYAPGQKELEKALRIVEAFKDAEARGLGVVSLGSKMIDPPVVDRARRLIDEARELGLLPETGEGGAS